MTQCPNPTGARRALVQYARRELFDHLLCRALAAGDRHIPNRQLLERIAEQERAHYEFWLGAAHADAADVRISRTRLAVATAAGRLLGPAFAIRRLERGEEGTIAAYQRVLAEGLLNESDSGRLRSIIEEEREHERKLEADLADRRVAYLGAAALGMNDAVVELTGGLTGLASLIDSPRLVGFSGLIVGIAAALSMAASSFLSQGMSGDPASKVRPLRAAFYTGISYLFVVCALVTPFLFLHDVRTALGVTWLLAVGVILGFAYYSSVLQGVSFQRRFGQMLALGLGVAVVTFSIGRAVSVGLGISAP